MSSKEFDVNGTDYTITITEQVIGHVNNLKNLYNAAYEDPESFEDVSSEISNTITDIASTVEPEVEEAEFNIEEIERELSEKRHYTSTNRWIPTGDIKNGYVIGDKHTRLISDAAALDYIVF